MRYSELKSFVRCLREHGLEKVLGHDCWQITHYFPGGFSCKVSYTFHQLYYSTLPLHEIIAADWKRMSRDYEQIIYKHNN